MSSTSSAKRFKRFIYGNIPYTFYRIFSPESPKTECYKFIIDHGYGGHFLYEFTREYDKTPIDVYEDEGKKLRYVLHRGDKKLYFPNDFTLAKIKRLYISLIVEQDIRCPHHYVDSIEEFRNKVILDIGSAEGLISLDAVEVAGFVYLFECEPKWIEALTATFEPWKDKVTIINKYISDRNDETHQTLDDFLKDKPKNNLFLKMDIEGAERKALAGGTILFSEANDLQFAICTYHKKDDEKVISSFLDTYRCTYIAREGFFYYRHRLRPCLLRGSKEIKDTEAPG